MSDWGSYATEYALFKHVFFRTVSVDDFMVLPRSSDEMTRDHVSPTTGNANR